MCNLRIRSSPSYLSPWVDKVNRGATIRNLLGLLGGEFLDNFGRLFGVVVISLGSRGTYFCKGYLFRKIEMASLVEVLVGVLTILYKLLESLVLLFVPKRLRYKKVDKDIVLITGGGSGIGRQMALRFAKLGATVVTWDMNQEGNEETVKLVGQQGGKGYGYLVDVTNRKLVYSTADKVRRDVGKVSILINNAGLVGGKRLLDLQDEQIEKTFAVNAISHFWTCKAFLPDMMTVDRGHIVNVASMAGLFGVEKLTEYCASKHAVMGFTESLLMELRYGGFKNVHVSAICPMAIQTGFFDGFKMGPFPMLTTDDAVDQIMSAILTNQKMLMLPGYMYLLVLAKVLFPIEVLLTLGDLLGSSEAMRNFRGRANGQTSGGQQKKIENGQSTSNGEAKQGGKAKKAK